MNRPPAECNVIRPERLAGISDEVFERLIIKARQAILDGERVDVVEEAFRQTVDELRRPLQ